MRRVFILLIAVFLAGNLLAQGNLVFGKLTNSDGNPVPDVTVFIAFTSKHTTTNNDGYYILKGLPDGEHELVFRHLSYKPTTKLIVIDPDVSFELDVTVEESIIEMDEIILKADPSNWVLGWVKFQEFVLGDPFGRDCEVVNREDLFFYFNGSKLTGHASRPIGIINNYLGYKIIYFLDYFWFNEAEGTFAFSGAAFYEDRFDDFKLRQRGWTRNRKTEFSGTLRHFLMAVFYEQIAEQGYVVRETWDDMNDLQKSEHISPSIAHVRFNQMRKHYHWDPVTKKSANRYFFPGEEFPIYSFIKDLDQVPAMKEISISDKLLVYNTINSNTRENGSRVAYFALYPDKKGGLVRLQIDDHGDYNIIGGQLVWSYLDVKTNLTTAMPADYIPGTEHLGNR